MFPTLGPSTELGGEKEVVGQIIYRNNMKLVKAKQAWRGCVCVHVCV